MKVKAAIAFERNKPLTITEVDLESPRSDEVLVRLTASGICHSDISTLSGGLARPMPCIFGHEGSGIVEEVGASVTMVRPGDHVVLSWSPDCGKCYYCNVGRRSLCEVGAAMRFSGEFPDGSTRFSYQGQKVYQFTGTFSTHTVLPEYATIKVREDAPLEKLALLGCGVMTGVGAAINTAQVQPGTTVAVFGCGGVGLNTIQGAALCSPAMIIGVDTLDNKLQMAKQMGATHIINASQEDPVAAIKELTGGTGVDYAFEVIGIPEVMSQAFDATRRGGMTVIVGAASGTAQVSFPAQRLALEERIVRGSLYGSARPSIDFPRLVDLYMKGKLNLDMLVSRAYSLEQINEAFKALEAGENIRGVIIY